jgi:hypothetical protein
MIFRPRRKPGWVDLEYRQHALPEGVKIDRRDRGMAESLHWHVNAAGHVVNVLCSEPYPFELKLSRLIMLARHDQVVRHENGDLLDCRRANLIVERA